MLVAGLVSWKLELGQTRRIVVSSVRCFMQLLAAGFLLTYLFEFQTWWLVALVLAAMVIAATQIAVSRVKSRIPGLVPSVFVSLFVSSLVVGFIVVEGVVRADPWFHARQVVPIVGMIMGNAMAAVAVAIDRLFSDLDARASEMFSLTALGLSLIHIFQLLVDMKAYDAYNRGEMSDHVPTDEELEVGFASIPHIEGVP